MNRQACNLDNTFIKEVSIKRTSMQFETKDNINKIKTTKRDIAGNIGYKLIRFAVKIVEMATCVATCVLNFSFEVFKYFITIYLWYIHNVEMRDA